MTWMVRGASSRHCAESGRRQKAAKRLEGLIVLFFQHRRSRLQQQQNGGAAELEVALLLAPADPARPLVVADLTHHQRPHLHLDHPAEVDGVHDGVLPLVLEVDGIGAAADGPHSRPAW